MAQRGDDAFKDFGAFCFIGLCRRLFADASFGGSSVWGTSTARPPSPGSLGPSIAPLYPFTMSTQNYLIRTIMCYPCIFIYFISPARRPVSDDYTEYDEDQMLERAIDMGMSFEQALELISSGKGGTLLGRGGGGAGKGGNTQVCAVAKIRISVLSAHTPQYMQRLLREYYPVSAIAHFTVSLASSEYFFTTVFHCV